MAKQSLEARANRFLRKYLVDLEVSLHVPLKPYEPDDLLLHYFADIVLDDSDDGSGHIVAGTIEAWYAQFALASSGESGWGETFSRFDVLDAHCTDSAEYIELFSNPDDDEDDGERWSAAVREQCPDTFCSADLLILQLARIEPQYRGSGLGLMAVRRLIDTLTCGHEVLIAYHPNPPGMDEAEPGYAAAREKLKFYWSRLGSKPVEGTDLWVMSSAERWPNFKQMLSEVTARKPRSNAKTGRKPLKPARSSLAEPSARLV